MSFGYSVSDFIAVVQLSKQIYDGCKASTDQYRDIGRDVGNTHIVLGAIEKYWNKEKARGHDLIMADQESLKDLGVNCRDILKELEGVLKKHQKLGERARIRDKVKWYAFTNDMGPIRTRLQNCTHALAMFNATLTSDIAADVADEQTKLIKEQSQILSFFVERYMQFQNGTGGRAAPAFSSVTAKDIEEDDNENWQNIDDELKHAGIGSSAVRSNRAFMRMWIDTVVSNDADEDDPPDLPEGSTVVGDDEAALETSGESSSRAQDGSTERSGEQNPPKTAQNKLPAPPPPPPPIIQRPISASSHRSQSSTWRDPSREGDLFAIKMLAKALKSKYGEDNEEFYIVPIKRAYHYLDYTDCGWLSKEEVQQHCKEAAIIAGIRFGDAELARLMKEMDKDGNNEINREELIEITMKMRDRILESISWNSENAGRIDAGIKLKSFFDSNYDTMLPSQWHAKINLYSQSTITWKYEHDLLGDPQLVAPLQRNFSNAAFIATSYCAPQIVNARSNWRHVLLDLPAHQSIEYTAALENVMKATARFHLFQSDDGSHRLNKLDRFFDHIDLIPLELYDEVKDWPVTELLGLRKQCWDLLVPILGFAYDLKWLKNLNPSQPSDVQFLISNSPPNLAEWRRLRMLERSRRIIKELPRWEDMKVAEQKCREWYDIHIDDVEVKVKNAIGEAEALYQIQQKSDPGLRREITIEDVRIDKLPRDGLFQKSAGQIVFNVYVDGVRVGHSETQDRKPSPAWFYGKPCNVGRDSKVEVEFHDYKDWYYHNSDSSSKSFIGSFEFKVKDITNFGKYSKVTTSGELRRGNRSGLSKSNAKAKVSVTVESRWDPENPWESSMGGIASLIMKHPIPSGWEPRRTKTDDVYLFNIEHKRPTACLWCDPIPSSLRPTMLKALPEGWTQKIQGGKLEFVYNLYFKASQTHPETDEKSTFENVLKAKEFCQIRDFLPQAFIDIYVEEAKPKPFKLPSARADRC